MSVPYYVIGNEFGGNVKCYLSRFGYQAKRLNVWSDVTHIGFQMGYHAFQPQQIAAPTKTGDRAQADGRNLGVMAERFAGVGVGEVYFDGRQINGRVAILHGDIKFPKFRKTT